MIRIIFENGGIAEFNNVNKIYIEEKDFDKKVIVVGRIVPIEFADFARKENEQCTNTQ